MAMQTDVKAAAVAAGTATAVTAYRSRIKGIVVGVPAAGGALTITDGNGGATLFAFTAAAAAGNVNVVIPGEGILATTGIYVTPAAGMTATVFYG